MLISASARVPGTSANLGPGYDCLGIALALYNTVHVRRTIGNQAIVPAHPMIDDVAGRFFACPEVDREVFGFSWSMEGDVPSSRGLGSSVTLRLGILECLNAICETQLSRECLFRLCAEAEKHPDNAGPAVFGGFFAGSDTRRWFHFPIDASLRFVLLIPNFEVQTSAARAVLPHAISHEQAACNTANAACLTAAFATKSYGLLPGLFEDYLHQPYRRHLIPGMGDIIGAGVAAGGYGGYLSGSGSTICVIAHADAAKAVSEAMQAAHPQTGAAAKMVEVSADDQGSHIVELGSAD